MHDVAQKGAPARKDRSDRPDGLGERRHRPRHVATEPEHVGPPAPGLGPDPRRVVAEELERLFDLALGRRRLQVAAHHRRPGDRDERHSEPLHARRRHPLEREGRQGRVDEDETIDDIGSVRCGHHRDQPAHRVPDECHRDAGDLADEADDELPLGVEMGAPPGWRGEAEPDQVRGIHPVGCGEPPGHGLPVAVGAAKSVDEDHREPVAAVVGIVDRPVEIDDACCRLHVEERYPAAARLRSLVRLGPCPALGSC